MSLEQSSELEAGFATFVRAAQRLEERYGDLQRRAESVDRELARTNATLASTLAEREVVLSTLPVGVVALAADGSTEWSNPEAARIGRRFSFDGPDWTALDEGVHRLDAGTLQVRRVELPDGGELVVGEDRSHLAHLEREVDRLDRLAGLSELALGVAHEIKNPLNGVTGYASMLARAQDLETAQRYGQRVLDGIRQVDDIVRQMLAFARPEGRQAVHRPLREVIREAAVASSGESSIVPQGDGLDEQVDSVVLLRALENLFRNSLESSDSKARVTVQAEKSDRSLVIDVTDDGPGIRADLRERLFEPFVSDKPTGSGLGLPLTARVLSFLGGRIDLVPSETGAHFRIELPIVNDRSVGGDS